MRRAAAPAAAASGIVAPVHPLAEPRCTSSPRSATSRTSSESCPATWTRRAPRRAPPPTRPASPSSGRWGSTRPPRRPRARRWKRCGPARPRASSPRCGWCEAATPMRRGWSCGCRRAPPATRSGAWSWSPSAASPGGSPARRGRSGTAQSRWSWASCPRRATTCCGCRCGRAARSAAASSRWWWCRTPAPRWWRSPGGSACSASSPTCTRCAAPATGASATCPTWARCWSGRRPWAARSWASTRCTRSATRGWT